MYINVYYTYIIYIIYIYIIYKCTYMYLYIYKLNIISAKSYIHTNRF